MWQGQIRRPTFLSFPQILWDSNDFHPSLPPGGPYSSALYEPLLTSDGVKGVARSSYCYNPRVKDAAKGDYLRCYQKSSQFEGQKFGCDVITEIRLDCTAHLPDEGCSVSFPAAAAKFIKSPETFDATEQMTFTTIDGFRTFGTSQRLDQVFDLLAK